ncbi:MAG: EI24 domain-containing protein [Myxococcaceae bacterium]
MPTPGFLASRADLWRGWGFVFRAISVIRRDRPLRRLALLASALTFLILAALLTGSIPASRAVIESLWSKPANGFLAFGWHAVRAVTFLLFFGVTAQTLPLLLLAPLHDALSEATERAVGRPIAVRQTWLRGAMTALAHTALRIATYLFGLLALLPVVFIPFAGAALWGVLGLLWTFAWLSAEYVDIPLTRHGHPAQRIRQLLRTRPWLCMSFGSAVYVLLWLPLLNLFLVPLAVVGGTLLYVETLAPGADSTQAQLDA